MAANKGKQANAASDHGPVSPKRAYQRMTAVEAGANRNRRVVGLRGLVGVFRRQVTRGSGAIGLT